METALNKTWAQSHILARGRGESFRLVYTSPRFHHDLQRADRFLSLFLPRMLREYLAVQNIFGLWSTFFFALSCSLTSNRKRTKGSEITLECH